MRMARWNPSNDLAGLHSAMDRLFSDVFGERWSDWTQPESGSQTGQQTFHLPVDISRHDNGYRIEAPVPGFRPEDVEVTMTDGVLNIEARRRNERTRQEGDYLRREVMFGDFRRQVPLPGDVRADEIKASFDSGVLTVDIPRTQKAPPKRIPIQAGQRQQVGTGSRN